MLGKRGWDAIPFDQPIQMAAGVVVALVLASVAGWITWRRHWPDLWCKWITSVDHKRWRARTLASAGFVRSWQRSWRYIDF